MKKKLIIVAVFLGIMFVLYGVDTMICKQYSIEITEISPNPSVADGETPVNITATLKKGDRAVENHILTILSKSGGSFKSTRIKTNAEGKVEYVYYPFLASEYLKAGDVAIEIADESNSLFISVPAKKEFTIQLTTPSKIQDGQFTTNDIYNKK